MMATIKRISSERDPISRIAAAAISTTATANSAQGTSRELAMRMGIGIVTNVALRFSSIRTNDPTPVKTTVIQAREVNKAEPVQNEEPDQQRGKGAVDQIVLWLALDGDEGGHG